MALVGYVPTQLPLGILEGFLTALAYRFILVRRPELLARPLRLLLLILVCLSAGSAWGGGNFAAERSAGNALRGFRPMFTAVTASSGTPTEGVPYSRSVPRQHLLPRLWSGARCARPPYFARPATNRSRPYQAWQAADDMVEQRFAAKGEAKPAEPAAEDRGELPGFFAMLAGAIGGFIAGYCFRALFPPRPARNCRTPRRSA